MEIDMDDLYQGRISFDKVLGRFDFAGIDVSFEDIGAGYARAFAERVRTVRFGKISVTPNYLSAMLQFASSNGWFVDELGRAGQDHAFDPNEPTPGPHWQTVRSLRRLARDEAAVGKQLEEAGRPDLALSHKRRASESSQAADELARTEIPQCNGSPASTASAEPGDKAYQLTLWLYFANGEGRGVYCTDSEDMRAKAEVFRLTGLYHDRRNGLKYRICRMLADTTVREFLYEERGSPLAPPEATRTGFHPSTSESGWQAVA
jgi:hypothetical protein